MAFTGRGLGRFHLILLMLWTLSQYSSSSQIRQEFREQPIGTYVGTIETKPSFAYRFSENHKLFAINGTTGVIYTSSVIDREILQSNVINVVVLSSQPTYPTEVRIVVLDINDNSPVFPDSSIVVSFKEDASSGRQVILDTATDSDIGSNGVDHTTYRIVNGNEQRKFRLDITVNPSGEGAFCHLVSTGGLDREVTPFFQLLIEVEDKGDPKKFGYMQVNVTIQDINDNPPMFDHDQYQTSVFEDTAVGSSVLQITASDRDEGANADIRYFLDEGTPFQIDPKAGTVIIKESLDYERKKEYSLTIHAMDNGAPSLSGRSEATIKLLDVNDNDPVEALYRVDISEDIPKGSYIKGVSATDGDSGQNANLRYSLVSGNGLGWFAISENSGLVTSAALLDREVASEIVLNISAKDQGLQPKMSYTKLIVNITDVNDQVPTFTQSTYHVSLVEHSPAGAELLLLSASDDDLGANGTIRFSFDPETPSNVQEFFRLDVVSGRLSTATELDREDQGSYFLYIQATDSGCPPLHSIGKVNVTLSDINDNRPVFYPVQYFANVKENEPSGSFVTTVLATDPDLGRNGTVKYIITAGDTSKFHINSNSGQITTQVPLDREEKTAYQLQQSFYQLKVIARGGEVTGEALVNVTVKDLNDNAPHFIHAAEHVSAVENWSTGHLIFQAKASDPDEGTNGMVLYSLTQNPKGLFHIHEKHGLITLTGPLELTTSSYQVEVLASDLGVPLLTSRLLLTVSVYDVNDNSPVFDQLSYEVIILESEPVNSRFFKVEATDKDSGLNGEVMYDIVGGNTGDVFGIFPDGQLYIKAELDREVQDRYDLVLVATDRAVEPLSASVNAKVQVYIQDINDNPPKFTKDIYQASISESAQNLTQLLRVSAVDVDESNNGLVLYHIKEGNEESQFTIDRSSGQVTLVGKLDYEATSTYSLKMIAVDSGTVPLSSSCMLSISIQDENDNFPSFPKSAIAVDVLENMRIGELVASVTATDSDSGHNADITYSITATNNHGTFSISPNTGSIFLVKKLDFETQSFYKLNITARDNGRPPRSSTIPVVIHVRDFNDNPPIFTPGDIFKSIPENMPLSASVMTITAHDTDADINGQLEYSIVQQTPRGGHFSIDPSSGLICTNKEIDREFSNLFELTVKATDQAVPVEFRRFALKNVTIWVTDLNDNVPTFISQNALVAESTIVIGSILTTVVAFDPDEGSNGEVEYELVKGDSDTFIMDRYSGDIRLASQLVPSCLIYSLTVSATDHGSDRKTSRTELTIILQGADGPVFSQPKYITILKEGQPPGTNVISLDASSPRGSATKVEFFIVSVRGGGKAVGRLFTIGLIQTAAELDREQGSDLYLVDVYAIETDASQPRTQRAEVSSLFISLHLIEFNGSFALWSIAARQHKLNPYRC
ncbi:unnamed protein product [Oncorhynchus mykiss]|uniref:Cadherin domain-containing protein n=1 Tax=Oncorhynchus mykiss TaxID=8022 RepID=A0A060WRT0_ONCMY|nr:unnamed protein product [Oncorhynchus mykiss]